jgi:6-phosphogluconolactonase (cycloisomerase 2 family)
MFGGTLWLGTWAAQEGRFSWHQAVDFKAMGQGMPLEVYYDETGDLAYVSTASPGNLNVFDISDPTDPKLIHAIPTAGGAHHMAFSEDRRYAFVQNSLLNLPGLHDGSISVVDLEKGEVVGSIDVLKEQGLTPNNIALLKEGHAH